MERPETACRWVFTGVAPTRTPTYSTILRRLRTRDPDVLAAGTFFGEALAVAGSSRSWHEDPRMSRATVGIDLCEVCGQLGGPAETCIYADAPWVPELRSSFGPADFHPVARGCAGARAVRQESLPGRSSPSAILSWHSAARYGGLPVPSRPVRAPPASMDSGKAPRRHSKNRARPDGQFLRTFRVDAGDRLPGSRTGASCSSGRTARRWSLGQELAPDKARFPTPPWSSGREQSQESRRRRGPGRAGLAVAPVAEAQAPIRMARRSPRAGGCVARPGPAPRLPVCLRT